MFLKLSWVSVFADCHMQMTYDSGCNLSHLLLKVITWKQTVVTYICNSSTWEGEAGDLQLNCPELCSEF